MHAECLSWGPALSALQAAYVGLMCLVHFVDSAVSLVGSTKIADPASLALATSSFVCGHGSDCSLQRNHRCLQLYGSRGS